MSIVLSKGLDIHRLDLDYYYSPQEETPTSLAMYSEFAFAHWQYGLNTIKVDLKMFTEEELKKKPLCARWLGE